MDLKRKIEMIQKARTILNTKKMVGQPQSEFVRIATIEVYKQECGEFFLEFGEELVSFLEAQRAAERANNTEH